MNDLGSRDCVILHPSNFPAERMQGIFSAGDFNLAVAGLHGQHNAAWSDQGEAELAEYRQGCHGSADSDIVNLPVFRGELLRSGVDALHVLQAECIAGFLQKIDSFSEAVQQGHPDLWSGDCHWHSWETGAAPDINDRL